jgi:Zn-dependent protease with chaperone function
MRHALRRFAVITLAVSFATLFAIASQSGRARAQAAVSAATESSMATATRADSAGAPADSAAMRPDSLAARSDSAAIAPGTAGTTPPAPRDYIAEVRAAFTPENRAYSTRRVWLAIIEPFYAIAVGLLLLFSGAAARLRDVAESMGKRRYVHVLIYFMLYSAVAWLLTFPLSWYGGFALEHQFALSTQTFGGWFADELKGQVVMIVFVGVVPLLSLAYRTMEKSPRFWWLWCAVATLPLVAFSVLIEPVVIDPIFNKFTPLPDVGLRTEILDLAKRAGIPARKVYEVDESTRTVKYNAYVNGFGASQRIVIWDTTLKGMSHDEILFVMGHEMGHYVLGHIWKGVVAISLASFALFWLSAQLLTAALARWGKRWGIRSLHDVASIPLLALVLSVISLAVQPVSNAYSRQVEHEADLFGLEVTHMNDAGARAFIKLGSQNRSNPEPAAWLVFWEYTHPPLLERVRTALEYHPWSEGRPNRYFHPGTVDPGPR